MAKNSQRAKLVLKARENLLTKDVKNDYYLTVKSQRTLTLADLAKEVAATHGHQNESEAEMLAREILELGAWYLSNGFGITTPLGYHHATVSGTLLDSELNAAPDRTKLKFGVSYAMSDLMRKCLDEAELDLEIDKAKTGPQLFSVVSAQDAQHPDAATRGDSVPVAAGEACILKGRNLKVGGPAEANAGVTLTRQDKQDVTPVFIPAARLFPNTPTQVGFVMPAGAEEGSVWQVKLCTQLGSNGAQLLKEPRTVTMDDNFVVGQPAEDVPGGGGSGSGGGLDENPLG
ncbi:DUF4469 domain-containing protein [Bacteroides cellulosilyticus]|uniref:DUF4469 domain-containing protein n=1 Tax=Bacteroides cellulosilyticus TaxID=246787 RepID=UPI0032BF2FCF